MVFIFDAPKEALPFWQLRLSVDAVTVTLAFKLCGSVCQDWFSEELEAAKK